MLYYCDMKMSITVMVLAIACIVLAVDSFLKGVLIGRIITEQRAIQQWIATNGVTR